MDGASGLRIWWTIIMPLVRPATATVAIFLSLWIWNDFLNPLFILGPLQGQTITTGLYLSVGQFQMNYGQLFGIMFLAGDHPGRRLPHPAEAVRRRPDRGIDQVTADPQAAADGVEQPTSPAGVPDLDDVAGEWMAAADLAHLPSLRNQWGQGHVNHDLDLDVVAGRAAVHVRLPHRRAAPRRRVARRPSASAGSRGACERAHSATVR